MTAGRDQPLVSVIVPVHNGEDHLVEALESILAQSYPALEVIVMDDASSDGTAALLAAFADRIRSHRQPVTRGIYANVNDGIELARGELIAVYHADDVYGPDIVAREVAYLEAHPEVGAVFAADEFIDAQGRHLGQLELPAELARGRPLSYRDVLEALLRHKNAFLRCPSSMVRAGIYRDLGGYDQERFKNTSDLEMWLRIARRHQIGVIDEHLWRYRRGHGSSSERYHTLRVDPERFFTIVDLELEHGGREVVSSAALATYEAHRAEDQLKISASHYILKAPDAAREALAQVSPRAIVASRHPRRTRLVAFHAVMRVLLALPRTDRAAELLGRRVYGGTWSLAGTRPRPAPV